MTASKPPAEGTPRTDALGDQPLTLSDITPPYPVLTRWYDFARTLERELTAERQRCEAALADAAHVRQTNANYREENLLAIERAEQAESRAASAVALLRRYRNETPLGHQPHMIAHEADATLAALDAASGEAGGKS